MNKLYATLFFCWVIFCDNAYSLPIECPDLDTLLPSKTWYSKDSGNNHYFTRTGEWKGQRKLSGGQTANYQLSFRILKTKDTPKFEGREICLISFTYLNGDCDGDVHTWVVETIGDGLRFRTYYADGDNHWDFTNESSATSCDIDGYLILPR